MNAELKQEWLEALRSGLYAQGKEMLRSPENKYCCLGVLCDVSGMGKWDWSIDDAWSYKTEESYCASMLPVEMNDIIGLDHVIEARLIEMNDTGGATFAEIADWIETNL